MLQPLEINKLKKNFRPLCLWPRALRAGAILSSWGKAQAGKISRMRWWARGRTGRQGFWDRAEGSPRPTLVTAAHMCIISMPGVPGEGHRGGDFLGGESCWGLEMGPICLPAVCSFTEHLEGSGE